MSGFKKSNSVLQESCDGNIAKQHLLKEKTEAEVVLTGRLSVYPTSLVGGDVGEIFYQGARC